MISKHMKIQWRYNPPPPLNHCRGKTLKDKASTFVKMVEMSTSN